MNDAPVPSFQPTLSPESNHAPQPSPQVAPLQQPPQGSQALSTWSLVLGIIALVLAIVFFVSIPTAIVAVILGSIVLVKHRPGKGKALAGIITGGIALLVIPIFLVITLVAFNGISNTAKDSSLQQLLGSASTETKVDTPCFSYTIPAGYTSDSTAKGCTTSINIPNGDTLTRITVKGNTGAIGSLQDVVAMFNTTLKNNDPNTEGVIDHEQLTSNGHTVYYIAYKDANGLLFGNYIIPDSSASQKDETGKTITAYTVAGYAYNSSLKGIISGILDNLTIK